MLVLVDDAKALGSGRIEETFGRRKHLVIHRGPDKLPIPRAAQQGI